MPSEKFESPISANDQPGQKRHPAFEEGESVGEAAQRIIEKLKTGKLPVDELEQENPLRKPPAEEDEE